MVELGRLIRKLSKEIITPEFLASEWRAYKQGIEKTQRMVEAVGRASLSLTEEEERLADQYEVLYLGGQRPEMTDKDDQRLTNQISAQFPGAREAYEKRDRFFNEALQQE